MKSTTAGREAQILPDQFSRFFDLSLDMLCIAGLDGYFKMVNPAWEATLGFTVEEMVNRPFIDFIHPDDVEATNEMYATQIEQGKDVVQFETRYLCKDGSYKWLVWNAKTVTEEELIYAIARDITERKRAEEMLQRLAAIVDSSDDAIVGKTLDGQITSWNRGAEQLYGYSVEEAVGRPISLIIPPDRSEEMPAILGNIARGEGVHHFESRRLRKDGQVLDVSLTVSPVRDSRGRITGASTIARDITERKRAEEALAQKTLELEHSNAELEDFTHVVSHDLKEPLRGIEAFSGFLAEDYADKLDEDGRKYLTILQDSAVRMRDLIDDLLQLSKLGRIKPQYVASSLSSLLRGVAATMQFSLREKGVDLRVQKDLPTFVCDSVRIEQVFENLISNAVKYNDKPTPVVEVNCSEGPDEYIFSVSDNGPGIDPKYHEKIFRIFQRLVLREDHEGTGVGLTICKKIVEGHGGRIWVESDGSGHGSAFSFSIPKSIKPSERPKENQNGQRSEAGTHPSGGGQSARRGDHEEGAGQGPAEKPAHSGARRSGGA